MITHAAARMSGTPPFFSFPLARATYASSSLTDPKAGIW